MTKDRIEKIRESKQRAFQRQYDNFQSTGDGKYYTRAKAYEEFVDICDDALANADELEDARRLKMVILELAEQADACLYHGIDDRCRIEAFLKTVKKLGKAEGYHSRWD